MTMKAGRTPAPFITGRRRVPHFVITGPGPVICRRTLLNR